MMMMVSHITSWQRDTTSTDTMTIRRLYFSYRTGPYIPALLSRINPRVPPPLKPTGIRFPGLTESAPYVHIAPSITPERPHEYSRKGLSIREWRSCRYQGFPPDISVEQGIIGFPNEAKRERHERASYLVLLSAGPPATDTGTITTLYTLCITATTFPAVVGLWLG